ncbi:MAG: hypothetical protein AB1405_02055 [Bdellovibrionota bacterium]
MQPIPIEFTREQLDTLQNIILLCEEDHAELQSKAKLDVDLEKAEKVLADCAAMARFLREKIDREDNGPEDLYKCPFCKGENVSLPHHVNCNTGQIGRQCDSHYYCGDCLTEVTYLMTYKRTNPAPLPSKQKGNRK